MNKTPREVLLAVYYMGVDGDSLPDTQLQKAIEQLYQLLLDEAGYMVAVGDADGEVKEGRTYYTFDVQQAVPLTAINRLFNKSNGDNTK